MARQAEKIQDFSKKKKKRRATGTCKEKERKDARATRNHAESLGQAMEQPVGIQGHTVAEAPTRVARTIVYIHTYIVRGYSSFPFFINDTSYSTIPSLTANGGYSSPPKLEMRGGLNAIFQPHS